MLPFLAQTQAWVLANLVKIIITTVIALVLVISGWTFAYNWDRRPAGTPHILWFHWVGPDSLLVQLDKAQDQIRSLMANQIALKNAINAQNASIAEQKAQSDQSLAKAQSAIDGLQKQIDRAKKTENQIAVAPDSSFDDVFVESLKVRQ